MFWTPGGVKRSSTVATEWGAAIDAEMFEVRGPQRRCYLTSTEFSGVQGPQRNCRLELKERVGKRGRQSLLGGTRDEPRRQNPGPTPSSLDRSPWQMGVRLSRLRSLLKLPRFMSDSEESTVELPSIETLQESYKEGVVKDVKSPKYPPNPSLLDRVSLWSVPSI